MSMLEYEHMFNEFSRFALELFPNEVKEWVRIQRRIVKVAKETQRKGKASKEVAIAK